MAYYTRYEKLQKYYKDGTAVEPAEYKKGANLGVAEYSSIEECQGQPVTCCIKWEGTHSEIGFQFNYRYDITTKENPWCTKEKVLNLDFHKGYGSEYVTSLDITIDETNSISSMYSSFNNLSNLNSIKLNMPKAASLSDISNMFENSINLTSINFINFDTSHVTTAESAFRNCSKLTSLDVSNWNTSNLQNASLMFADCRSLVSLNLKNFDMSNVTNATWMFHNCSSLNHIICKQAFKNWCITNQDEIELPTAMREGGTGTWTIVD